MGNLKRLGVQSRPLDGRDRLAVLHGQMHPGGREPFRFAWKDIPKTGMGTCLLYTSFSLYPRYVNNSTKATRTYHFITVKGGDDGW